MNKIIASAKKSWAANKTKIVSVALVTVTGVAFVQHVAIKQHNDFLKENDLFDQFYRIDE
jgi:hypothetical protein